LLACLPRPGLNGLKFRRAGLGGLELGNGYSRAMRWAALLLLWLLLAASANAQSEPDEPLERGGTACPIEARGNEPPGSRHRTIAIALSLDPIHRGAERGAGRILRTSDLAGKSPAARCGRPRHARRQTAQGIPQFMPATAAERLLLDAFDPAQALPKSAEFLRELRVQFGNLGLAAAAYNAGPQRVRDWLAGKRGLPSETLAYVRSVTGHSAEEWRHRGACDPFGERCGVPRAQAGEDGSSGCGDINARIPGLVAR
jgi:Transglycosylase SLT domain